MTNDESRRHDRLGELFLAASALPPEQRAEFLAAECADDPELRVEVEAMLGQDVTALGQRAGEAILEGARHLDDETLPESIGGYRLLRRIGAGGMGIVYEAEQSEPSRRVALKVIRPGFANESTLRRFRYEAQVLGWLDHPGIARIYEAGTEDDGHGPQPWFAMELIEGEPLTEYARRRDLDLAARLDLLARICDAAHHAHQKGVIHRDLKPGNVLVDASGQPKILDFGVARVTDKDLGTSTLQTVEGELVGTLPYMSPEQIEAHPGRIDVRSDVYALGVVAFELLSGRLPHDLEAKRLAAAARAIVEDEPPTLGSLDPHLRGDVETIVGKAIEKEVGRRYASAEELASDIRRHLFDQPIQARPASAIYQLQKFARRNRAMVGAMVTVFVVLVAATGISVKLLFDTQNALDLAEEATGDAEDARAKEEVQRKAAEEARADEEVQRRAAEEAEEIAQDNARKAADEADATREMNNFLIGVFLGADPERAKGMTLTDYLERGAETLAQGFADRPARHADFAGVIGLVYTAIQEYEKAEPLLEEALALIRANPTTDEFLATCLVRLADLRVKQGRFPEATALLEEAMSVGLEPKGPERRTMVQTMRDFARVLVETGEYERAEAVAREVLRLVPGTANLTPMFTHVTRQTLGAALREQGDIEGAVEQLDLIMGDLEAAGEGRSANMAFMLTSMADLQLKSEEYAAAAETYRRGEQICAELPPNEGPPRWIFTAGRARALEAEGDLESATVAYEEAIEAKRTTGMARHPYMGTSLRLLARARLKQERPAEALLALTEALGIVEEARGPQHPDRGEIFAEVVKCWRLGKDDPAFTEALATFQEAMTAAGHGDELEQLERLVEEED